MKETKQEISSRIASQFFTLSPTITEDFVNPLSVEADKIKSNKNYKRLYDLIYQERSTLNPMKIDEERMMSIYRGTGVTLRHAIHQYNSTLEDHQVLQPLPSDEKTLNKISNIIIRYKDEHIYIEEAEKQIIEEVISPILASHVARILELEEKVKLINGDLDSSLEIINSLRSSCQ